MRYLLSGLVVMLCAPAAFSQGVAICSGDTYVAYASWERDGSSSVSSVTLDRPLTEASRRAIAGADGATELDCAASPRWQVGTGDGALPARVSAGSRWPLIVTCAGIEGVSDTGDEFIRVHPVGLWSSRLRPKSDRTSGGESTESFYLRVSARRELHSGNRRMRVELRERVTDRVERDLVLFDAECSG